MSAGHEIAAGRVGDAADAAAGAFDAAVVRDAPEPLRAFNAAGVLAAADVHVALRLAALAGDTDPAVALAAALAVRAPRLGHVYVDLATIRETAAVEGDEPVDLTALPWPEPAEWIRTLGASALAAVGEEDAARRPLRLAGSALYLDRYWREERRLAADLRAFSDAAPVEIDTATHTAALDRLFGEPRGGAAETPGGDAGSRSAAAEEPGGDSAALFDTADVSGDGADPLLDSADVSGGGADSLFDSADLPGDDADSLFDSADVSGDDADPLFDSADVSGDDADPLQRAAAEVAVRRRFAVVAGGPGTGKTTTLARIVALLMEAGAPLVALAAPTGKAAARLEEAVHAEARALDIPDAVRERLLALEASTLHRLLGRRPGSNSRFRHHRGNRLPHDVVIVDETSMVSLSLMARVVEAVRPDARLILVGDPAQLASIEAGAVLGDIVGPADGAARAGDGIVVLERVHRFGEGIADLAAAVRGGDADAVVAVLRDAPEGVTWLPLDVADPAAQGALAPVRAGAVGAARAVIAAAEAGEGAAAIAALGEFRVLCAHRRGAHGVATWIAQIEGWLAAEVDGFGARGRWYPGRPLLVTENDYGLRLYNGDTGVVVAAGGGRVSAAFERRGELLELPPTRLAAVDTVYAMTIHKSQGSQYGTAAVLLPAPGSRVLTRELLYTAVTRARRQLILAGTEEAVRAAVARPIARASGLRTRLWGA